MTNKTGILDGAKNPFWCKSWEDQRYSLTEGRRENLPALFGNDEDSIRKIFPEMMAHTLRLSPYVGVLQK